MATKAADHAELLRQLEDELNVLDALLLQNFPIGGHANVERAMAIANKCRALIVTWRKEAK